MKFNVGQVIKMKKPHPCGANEWEILRVGMDFRLKCKGCDHQVMVPVSYTHLTLPTICSV